MIETVVTKFGPRGNAEKDVSIKLEDVKQLMLDQMGDFTILNDSLVVAYKTKGEMWFQKEAAEPGSTPVMHQAKVQLKRPTDTLKDESDDAGGLRFWYDNHFYIWGYQQIKVTDGGEVQSRNVFYVSRIDL